jgi:hypothetical protein
MAVRLQMKLGLVPDADRLPDSPDQMVVVEPSVGSVARTKGSLYLLVTARGTGNRFEEATRAVADTIRTEYYYDESAGIRVCMRKAIQLANKKVAHQRDRLGLNQGDTDGPIGVGVAVVRGNELYVATVGPAEAYLIRQARLSTLPDPHRERGLPTAELEPEIWRGEIAVGDSLVLVSANVVARIGPDELKDAMVTLHPQSAIEHLHHRFVASDGSGSDGAVAFEATEVSATSKQRTLVPVRPPEPNAGAPDRSPIPLADEVTDGVAALGAGAIRARSAAGSLLGRIVGGFQDLLPRRGTRHSRVKPVSSRREAQRRAAVAVLAFVAVVAALGLGVFFLGSRGSDGPRIDSVTAAERAFQQAQADVAQVFGPGVDLVRDDQEKAKRLLTDAYQQLQIARDNGMPDVSLTPLLGQVTVGLDRAFRMLTVNATLLFSFEKSIPKADLRGVVLGPDGVPYVIDHATRTVYRIDLKAKKATVVLRNGQLASGSKAAEPKFLAVGGPDLLILDVKNILWRWRPADTKGAGTLTRVTVNGASGWGTDIKAIGTFLRSPEQGLYNLYVVDPSDKQILRYSPAADGSGYPAAPTGFLATAQSLDDVEGIYIDGDVYLAEGGLLRRFVGGQAGGWQAADPGDTILRPSPHYVAVTSPGDRQTGSLYGYDKQNARVLAFDKASGSYTEEYRTRLSPGWQDLRGFYVIPGANGDPATLFWIDGKRFYSSTLKGLPTVVPSVPSTGSGSSAGASGAASSGPSGTSRAAGTAAATARPTRTSVATSTP